MDTIALIVGLSIMGIGLLYISLAIPLAQSKIGRNGYYGFRLSQSLASDEAWRSINQFGGKRMILWAMPLIAVGLISLFLPLNTHHELLFALCFAPLVFVLIPAYESWRFAKRHW